MPQWKNDLFASSFAQQKFLRLTLRGDQVRRRGEVFSRLGRVRDLETGPDGFLYVAPERIGKPGVVVRLVPARAP